MATSKEVQQASRPLAHRPSISSTSITGSSAPRQTHSRSNSHSILSGALNANHRVTRRKSVTSSSANAAAVAAAIKEAGENATAMPIVGGRRVSAAKNGASHQAPLVGSLPSPPASLPTHHFAAPHGKMDFQGSAIDDDPDDMSEGEQNTQKARVRRASDGQTLVKEGRKSIRVELHCDHCGKGYKHSSCLAKHMWEHTPQWSITSKLLISKHQQVQLLEAASVLVNIKDKGTTPPDSAGDFNSDRDSASPAASAYSDQLDGRSSVDTTPPPQLDGANPISVTPRSISKRYSGGSGFSRSYQSAPSNISAAGSAPNGNGFGHHRQLSQDQRPTSSGSDVAAAMELLSCSFGSNSGSRTVHLPPDAPPVPPVPRQYLDQTGLGDPAFLSSFSNRAPESFARGELPRDDVKMEGSGESTMDDDDEDMRSRARSDEDDDGVFGRMEE